MDGKYIFDKDDVRFRRERMSFGKILRKILRFFLASISLAVIYYVVFALLFNTDTERRLKRENRMLEESLPQLEQKEALLSDVVANLELRDDRIYEEIFHTSAPNMDPGSSIDYLIGLDSIPDMDIVKQSAYRLDALKVRSADVEANFRAIIDALQKEDLKTPPMTNPLKDFSFAQTGASVGEKMNPFYKVNMNHDGLDMIAPSGNPVYASADGIVKEAKRSRKGLGNVVLIDHENGYFTRYAHLADIDVAKGRRVKLGTKIGTVGVSGNSFAPHLHYEVLRDTVVLDPVNHMFASVTPEEYLNMMILSVSTGQSMD